MHPCEGHDSGGDRLKQQPAEVDIAPQGGVVLPCLFKRDPEQFLVHFQHAIAAIRHKGLQAAYENGIKGKAECTKKLTIILKD